MFLLNHPPASAVTSGGGDSSRNPRVADLADLECSVDLGKAEAGRFKVSKQRVARCNLNQRNLHFYRVTLVVAYLGWVDYDFSYSLCPYVLILPVWVGVN